MDENAGNSKNLTWGVANTPAILAGLYHSLCVPYEKIDEDVSTNITHVEVQDTDTSSFIFQGNV